MNIAVYLRVSTDEQSTALQRREIEAYLTVKGWDTHTILFYEDHGASGTTANRTNLKRMMSDARDGRFQKIVIWKLDRLFRSLKDLIHTLQLFDQYKIEFISIRDNLDLSSASGRLMMHMIGAFAEFEAALIKERVKAGMDNAKRNGTKSGRTIGRERENDYELIRQARTAGKTYSEIRNALKVSQGAIARAINTK